MVETCLRLLGFARLGLGSTCPVHDPLESSVGCLQPNPLTSRLAGHANGAVTLVPQTDIPGHRDTFLPVVTNQILMASPPTVM